MVQNFWFWAEVVLETPFWFKKSVFCRSGVETRFWFRIFWSWAEVMLRHPFGCCFWAEVVLRLWCRIFGLGPKWPVGARQQSSNFRRMPTHTARRKSGKASCYSTCTFEIPICATLPLNTLKTKTQKNTFKKILLNKRTEP